MNVCKRASLSACGCALFAAASLSSAHPATQATESAERQIAHQVTLWNGGDLEAVLATYCPRDDIAWVNHGGLSHGYGRFAQSMREEFGGGAARMGTLAIDLLESRDLGAGGTLVVVRWAITRNGRRLMGGVSSQLWADCEGAARVVFEHAS